MMRLKNPSIVPSDSCPIVSTNRRNASRNAACFVSGRLISSANFRASVGLLAAFASLVRMPSKNSPAALRVNVSAMIRSTGNPQSNSLMNRLVN